VEFASVVSAVLRSSAVRRPPVAELHRNRRQGTQKIEGPFEGLGPRPVERRAQRWAAGAADEAAGDGQEAGAHGAGHGEMVFGRDVSEHGCPADEIVSKGGAHKPSRVAQEVSGGDVLEAGALF